MINQIVKRNKISIILHVEDAVSPLVKREHNPECFTFKYGDEIQVDFCCCCCSALEISSPFILDF